LRRPTRKCRTLSRPADSRSEDRRTAISRHTRGGLTSAKRLEAATGYAFVAPSVLGYLVFTLGPVIAALVLSFTKYDILSAPRLVGLSNYGRLLSDGRLIQSYGNTVIYVVAAVVLMNGLGLILAAMLNRHLPGPIKYALRSAYFFPFLVALVYVSVIWQALFQKDTGIINFYLTQLGGPRIDWLNQPPFANLSVIIVDVWRNTGFAMLIFLAALQEVPVSIVEAAQVDGAGPITIFRRITLPLITPAIFLTVTLTMIGAFQIYESVIVLTGGGPGDATRSVAMYLAEKGFTSYDMGYASAIAMTLFAIIMVLTLLQFRLRARWVHYE